MKISCKSLLYLLIATICLFSPLQRELVAQDDAGQTESAQEREHDYTTEPGNVTVDSDGNVHIVFDTPIVIVSSQKPKDKTEDEGFDPFFDSPRGEIGGFDDEDEEGSAPTHSDVEARRRVQYLTGLQRGLSLLQANTAVAESNKHLSLSAEQAQDDQLRDESSASGLDIRTLHERGGSDLASHSSASDMIHNSSLFVQLQQQAQLPLPENRHGLPLFLGLTATSTDVALAAVERASSKEVVAYGYAAFSRRVHELRSMRDLIRHRWIQETLDELIDRAERAQSTAKGRLHLEADSSMARIRVETFDELALLERDLGERLSQHIWQHVEITLDHALTLPDLPHLIDAAYLMIEGVQDIRDGEFLSGALKMAAADYHLWALQEDSSTGVVEASLPLEMALETVVSMMVPMVLSGTVMVRGTTSLLGRGGGGLARKLFDQQHLPAVIRASQALGPDTTKKLVQGVVKGSKYRGDVYRAGSWKIPQGNIAANHRYSAPGRSALYMSGDRQTIAAEMRAHGVKGVIETRSRYVTLDNMLDLNEPSVRELLNIAPEALISEDYSITQIIGELARLHYRGIVVPSARNPDGFNVVLFEALE